MQFSIKACLLLLAAVAIALPACKKDDGAAKEEILTSKSCWKQTKSESYDDTTKQWSDDTIDDCDKDDCTSFKSDKTLTIDEGAVKCDPSDPQSTPGTWSLSSDGKTMTLTDTGLGITLTGNVVELSDTKLVLEINFLGFKSRLTWQPS